MRITKAYKEVNNSSEVMVTGAQKSNAHVIPTWPAIIEIIDFCNYLGFAYPQSISNPPPNQ